MAAELQIFLTDALAGLVLGGAIFLIGIVYSFFESDFHLVPTCSLILILGVEVFVVACALGIVKIFVL